MSIGVDGVIEGSNVTVAGRRRNASGGSDAFLRRTKGKARPSGRPKSSRRQDNRTRGPRVSVVAAHLSAARDEPAAVGQASRLGVALARKVHELSTARRENAALRRENAALRSSLGAEVEGGGE